VHDLVAAQKRPFREAQLCRTARKRVRIRTFRPREGGVHWAVAQRKGRFELADHVRCFWTKLAKSRQRSKPIAAGASRGEFERVGGSRTLKVDVRIVTATNRDLEDAVKKGTFRADLYYRITVVSIFVPPLRTGGRMSRCCDGIPESLNHDKRPTTRSPNRRSTCLCRVISRQLCANWTMHSPHATMAGRHDPGHRLRLSQRSMPFISSLESPCGGPTCGALPILPTPPYRPGNAGSTNAVPRRHQRFPRITGQPPMATDLIPRTATCIQRRKSLSVNHWSQQWKDQAG